ncbi:Malonyl CoA-acyl carrier protein transacylase [Streptomyces sp. YIM 121038]|uniref:ACP S-malonyltransferase n=1 Tax=Streptomyces sp. YIM 121038 TaxID=2136401 RepID=UPI0011107DA6|nr:ACP S-malonyltransferase [Streptomyces sp. YIM 121038]QCX73950.1 Malonyl CoA-acyl carrier protein transacylase [Streptomyces sp. YIM 121038]
MSPTVAFVFPGQGSQFPGMGYEMERWGRRADALGSRAEDVTGLPVRALMKRADTSALADPEVAQVLVLTWSLAALEQLRGHGWRPAVVAGHSLGEYTALVACGCIDQETALSLVARRGRAMAAAAAARRGAMAAIVGLAPQRVQGLCHAASADGEVAVVANWNSPRQVVVAGSRTAVEGVVAAARAAGALRARLLPVGGAYHSPLMDSAHQRLTEHLADVALAPPAIPFVSSTTGLRVTDVEAYRQDLLAQIISPVRWQDVMRTLADCGVDTYVEAGPGRVLHGLAREMARTAEHLTTGDALRRTPAPTEPVDARGAVPPSSKEQ